MIAIIPHGANDVNITLLWVCRTGSYLILKMDEGFFV